MNFCNKLECLRLANLSSLVCCLWGRPGAYPWVEYLKHSSSLQKFVTYGRKKFYNIGPGRDRLLVQLQRDHRRPVAEVRDGNDASGPEEVWRRRRTLLLRRSLRWSQSGMWELFNFWSRNLSSKEQEKITFLIYFSKNKLGGVISNGRKPKSCLVRII